jgi:uncharacterized membrane protein (DUF2068 family)
MSHGKGQATDNGHGRAANPLTAWLLWEFSRRIELTAGVRLIILDRFIKAVALLVGGVALMVVTETGGIWELAERVQDQLNLDSGRHLWLRLTGLIRQRFASLSRATGVAIAIAATLYGLLELLEGVGLLLRRRWAEYLVLLATCAFLPVEIEELVRRPTVLKTLAFIVNIAIIFYLGWRKRLFLDRPPAPAQTALERMLTAARRKLPAPLATTSALGC